MIELAEGLRWLRLGPGATLNAYVIGSDGHAVLIDAGARWSGPALLRGLAGISPVEHALTHAHADHAGASGWLCDRLGIPLSVGQADAEALATGGMNDNHSGALVRGVMRRIAPPPRRADRQLVEGDEVGGFTVLEVPGHSPGSLAFWHERRRLLVVGDVSSNLSPLRSRPWVRPVPAMFHHRPTRNAAALQRLRELQPDVVAFGHGMPIRGRNRARAAFDV